MRFVFKFLLRIGANFLALYFALLLFTEFKIIGGIPTLLVGAVMLAALYTFLRPVLKFFTTPLIWLTFGLFNLVLNMLILWIADLLLTQLSITDTLTLFWVSLLVALANIF